MYRNIKILCLILLIVLVSHIIPLCIVFWFLLKIVIDGDTIYTNLFIPNYTNLYQNYLVFKMEFLNKPQLFSMICEQNIHHVVV